MSTDFYGKKRRFLKSMIKFILFIVLIIVVPIGCLVAATAFAGMYTAYREATEWREKTTPLSSEVIEDLCAEFSLPPDHKLCRQDGEVYAPDFFLVIRDTFIPKISTYEDVQEKLARFQTELEPVTRLSNGESYFTSDYDLKGDGVTLVSFFFDGEGVLKKIVYVTHSRY